MVAHEYARLDHNAEIAAAPSNRRSRSRSVAWLSPLDGAARDDRMPAVMLVSVARYLPHHSSPRIENRVRLTMCGRASVPNALDLPLGHTDLGEMGLSRAACVLWRSAESGTSIDSAEATTNGMTIVIGPIQLLDANALGRLERLRAFAHGALEQLSADQQRCALSVSTFSAW